MTNASLSLATSRVIDLAGDWQLRPSSGNGAAPIPAALPGCAHEALLAAGRIPDPFFGENEAALKWVSEEAWTFSRSFMLDDADARRERLVLRMDGVDANAQVVVNGAVVARCDNAFRTWEVDLRPHARAGENAIELRFAPDVAICRERDKARHLPSWNMGIDKSAPVAWVRKSQCAFGWDWGPQLPSQGVFGSMVVESRDGARVADLAVAQEHAGGAVTLIPAVRLDAQAGGHAARFSLLDPGGREVAFHEADIVVDRASARLVVPSPRLWWPNGLGEQPIYTLRCEIEGPGGPVDATERRLGLRDLRLVRQKDRWGESFHFACNGVAFFAKGANWIPADAFVARVDEARYRGLLQSAADANMNMLRVWGGGRYEHDAFYDICDELGLCVWQDFMFACSTYPTFDDAWMRNVEAEAREQVRRLRHHPSIALWCGNNELEQGLVDDAWTERAMSWADYGVLFDDLLKRVTDELDPQRPYWPCSPHTPVGDRRNFNDPTNGDAHLWDVWHGRQPFEWYRGAMHRFCSEFGFQSFPEPATVAGYCPEEQRNVTSAVMEHHQRSGPGNSIIVHYMLSWFRLPVGFEATLFLSQVQQGLAIRYAVEHWRRHMPRCMGALYWQLNDCWPVASWASIDYHGRWKALHYMAKRFFAPVMLTCVEDAGAMSMDLHVSNDTREDFDGVAKFRATDCAGATLLEGSLPASVPAGTSASGGIVDLRAACEGRGARDVLFWRWLERDGAVVTPSEADFLVRPKHLELHDPRLALDIEVESGTEAVATLSAHAPALYAFLWSPGGEFVFEDNYMSLLPGSPRRLRVTSREALDAGEWKARLRAASLYDTYQPSGVRA